MLRYQKASGMTLSPWRSDAIHCTRKRAEKIALPSNPKTASRLQSSPNMRREAVQVARSIIAFPLSSLVDRFPDLPADGAAAHPADGEQIGEGAEHPVADPVVAPARGARPVGHRDLRDLEPLH